MNITAEQKKEYYEYLKSKNWLKIKKRIKQLYRDRCCNCQNKKKLQVHHLTYDNIFHEKYSDLRLLCSECHTNWHSSNLAKREYRRIGSFDPYKLIRKKKRKKIKGAVSKKTEIYLLNKKIAIKKWKGFELTEEEARHMENAIIKRKVKLH